MRIKNISTQLVVFNDLFLPNSSHNIELLPSAEIVIFDEDAEKSASLAALITASMVSKLSNEEPSASLPTSDPSTDLENWALTHDKLIQFITDAGAVATGNPEIFAATHAVAKTIRLAITTTSGVKDLLNSTSTFLITASTGTVNGASSATVTFSKGLASVSVLKATAGNVNLTVSAITHPYSAAVPPTTVTAAGTAQVQFA